MPIRITCGNCLAKLNAPESLAGKRVRCPKCSMTIAVPEPAAIWDEFIESELAPPESKVEPEPEPKTKPKRSFKPDSEPEPEFDWSQPLEPTSERPIDDEFDNIDELPALPKPIRKRATSARTEAGAAFVPRLGDEGPSMSSRRKDSSRATQWSDHTELGFKHWILALAMIPLALSIVVPAPSIHDRLAPLFREHPEIEQRIETAESKDAFLSALPDERVPGAHLPRNTMLHWGYAAASATVFLLLIIALFPHVRVGPGQLALFGLLTGTIGIVLLIAFQWIAATTMGFNIRGRGVIVALFYLVKLVGFSYRCATDPETGFALSFLGFTCGVGLCEELCKGLPIALYLGMADRRDWRTACAVGLASGIGFGVSEGIMYSSDYYNGIAPLLTYLVRFASCVTLHAIWASSVAILMYNNQTYLPGNVNVEDTAEAMLWFVVAYLGIAMVLHGLYDTLLKKDLDLAALAVAAASFAWWVWLLHYQQAPDVD